MKTYFLCISLAILSFANGNDCLRVLAIFPYQGKSHYVMFEPFLKELNRRGHEVTVVTHFPSNITGIKYIDMNEANKIQSGELLDLYMNKFVYYFMIFGYLMQSGIQSCETLMKINEIHNYINNNVKFDIMVTESFNSDCSLGIANKLNVPVVSLSTGTLLPHTYRRLGIERNPSYFPNHFFDIGNDPSLGARMGNLAVNYLFDAFLSYGTYKEQELLAKYYEDIPNLEQLTKNIKFVLVNHYFTIYGTRLYPNNIIEVGGMHVAKVKPLPGDIASFLDVADDAIYVSFGTMINPKTMPKETMDILIEVFNEIPHKIIWKWDTDVYSGNEKILVMNWVPQNDILAHPKVKLFISHAGMMGTTEAVHHGVAVVNIPIFGDQPSNAAFIREHGFGVTVHWSDLTKENLLAAIQTTTTDEFQKRVKEHSQMWHDRLKSPMDTAVFWTEFAAKHPNVSFSNPAAFVPTYKFYSLDIIAILLLSVVILILLVKKIISGRRKQEIKKSIKKKRN